MKDLKGLQLKLQTLAITTNLFKRKCLIAGYGMSFSKLINLTIKVGRTEYPNTS
jgi:hypothetical protein